MTADPGRVPPCSVFGVNAVSLIGAYGEVSSLVPSSQGGKQSASTSASCGIRQVLRGGPEKAEPHRLPVENKMGRKHPWA